MKDNFWWAVGLWIAAIVLIVFILSVAFPAKAADFKAFEGRPLFESSLANHRSPEFSISGRNSSYLGQNISYLEAAMGKDFSLVTVTLENKNQIQFAMGAGTWLTLGYKEGAFPLLTQDFLVNGALAFRSENLTLAFKYNHISAHMGDGMEKLLEENLDIPGPIAEEIAEPFAYSREFVSFHMDYQWNRGVIKRRVYGHVGYAIRMIPRQLGKYYIGGGAEVMVKELWWAGPFVAVDVTYNNDVDMADISGQVGIFILSEPEDYVTMRLAFTGHYGSDRRGQLVGQELKQVGVGIFVR
jgi:hypothetical protein